MRFWGYDSEAKENIVYYIVRIEEDKAFVLETTVPNYTDKNDIARRDYYLECMYRGCGFSDSVDDIRGCEAYNEENPNDSEFRMMHAADVVNNAVGVDSLSGPYILTNVTDSEKDFHWRDLINLRNCIIEVDNVKEVSDSDTTDTVESGTVSTKYSENEAVKVMKLIIKTAENVDVDAENITFDYSIENGIMGFTVFSENKDGDHPMAVCSGDVDLNTGKITYFSNIYGFDKEFVLSDYLN